ncbi:UPF0481 protein At3g47200-like [Neltuma alba]|uniref:UPF0481 protein At3g47200-like n=1 Tax=Neltuma alba TaxID=207710 RepID=UPI0010A47E71|nr:UPF0481 protein At3g47200-like [Prosopis alba]
MGGEWIVEIERALGCVDLDIVKTGSICRVPNKIREAEAEAQDKDKDKGYCYRPRFVAMGTIHRATSRSDLQIMEVTKWRYMKSLLSRSGSRGEDMKKTLKDCCKAIKTIEGQIRASYVEKIDMGAEEFARVMLLDACYLFELLLRLKENRTDDPPMDNKEKMLRLLTDLTLLENQIPFLLLTILHERLFTAQQHKSVPSPQQLAESLFECNLAGGAHFLHLIHSCSPDTYENKKERGKHPQLQRCARKLQAFGIRIIGKASETKYSDGNKESDIVTAALREFVDKFNFEITFEGGKLEIPTLHIKEATEVKWRNLIAWEQIGLTGIGYKFTSYAYFFKGLVCSLDDLKLLKHKGVITVHNEAINDEDLVKMFQSITNGAEQMDSRYRTICEGLNNAEVKGVAGRRVLVFTMSWHYLRYFVEGSKFWLFRLAYIYLGTAWRIAGVFSGIALFGLTITQTVYSIRAVE